MTVSTPPPALSVEGVAKAYGPVRAIEDASLSLAAGRVTCLLGRSGCGKSTLLRLIAGLERADRGTISAGDAVFDDGTVHVPPEARGVGLVFQDYALFPHLDVAANVGFGLARLGRAERDARVAALLARFHIAHLANAWPHRLSGGEQQRVAIARALARAPGVVLMDEPFSGLDGALRREIQDGIVAQLHDSGAAVLIVTHDAEEAMRLGDEIVLMDAGRTLQSGTPKQCYARPVSAAAGRLLGPINALPGRMRGGRFEGAIGAVMSGRDDGPATLLARPEAFEPAAEGFEMRVDSCVFLGDRYELSGRLSDAPMLVHLADRPAMTDGKLRLALRDDSQVNIVDRA